MRQRSLTVFFPLRFRPISRSLHTVVCFLSMGRFPISWRRDEEEEEKSAGHSNVVDPFTSPFPLRRPPSSLSLYFRHFGLKSHFAEAANLWLISANKFRAVCENLDRRQFCRGRGEGTVLNWKEEMKLLQLKYRVGPQDLSPEMERN